MLRLLNSDTRSSVDILPDFGSILNDFTIYKNGIPIHLIKGYKTDVEMRELAPKVYRSSILFPYPNRIKDGEYKFNGKQHQFDINFPDEHNSIHGLVHDLPFEVIGEQATESEAKVILGLDYKGELPGYPFLFKIQITLVFNHKDEFTMQTSIQNPGSDVLPFGYGWHPYFNAGSSVDHMEISFPSTHKLIVDDRMIPTGDRASYDQFNSESSLEGVQLDDCFLVGSGQKKVVTRIRDTHTGAHYSVWQESGVDKFNFLQVYTPPDRDCIAIEPMTCPPDAFNSGESLLKLNPGASWAGTFGVSVL